MTIAHHPTGPTLISYASGTLPAALAGLVACHASLCPECAGRIRQLEIVGGLLLQAAESQPVSDTALRKATERCGTEFAEPQKGRRETSETGSKPVLPLPLARYLGMELDEIPWRKLVKGLEQYKVKLPRGGGEMRILRARPRMRLLKHSHRGMELTMVIKGTYCDETGSYRRGDVSDLAEDIEHQPKVTPEEECIAIIASERPPRYSDLLPRLLRPIMDF